MKWILVFCVHVVTELYQLLSSRVAWFTADHMHVLLSTFCQCGAVQLETLNTFNIYDYSKHQFIYDLRFSQHY
jgi:hypothetical protein